MGTNFDVLWHMNGKDEVDNMHLYNCIMDFNMKDSYLSEGVPHPSRKHKLVSNIPDILARLKLLVDFLIWVPMNRKSFRHYHYHYQAPKGYSIGNIMMKVSK